MAGNAYRIMSADSHFVEPPDLFTSRVAAGLRDRAPRTEMGLEMSGFEGEFWVMPGSASAEIRPVATFFGAGRTMAEAKADNLKGFAGAPDFVFDPGARLAAQDRDGVVAEVLYSSVGLVLYRLDDDELRKACFRAFNDWAAEYCSYDLKRLLGCAIVDIDDIPSGVRELERVAAMGLHGAMITGRPSALPYSSEAYDPLWAAAQDLDLPLSMHVHTNRKQVHHGFGENVVHSVSDIQLSLIDMMMGGAFDRFPRLKVILAEIDVSWIPHFMHRADHFFTRYRSGTGLSMIPSEYMRQNVWATFQDEGATLPFAAQLFGADRLLWASDFPHMNSTYPDTQKFVHDNFPGMDPEDVQKIVGGNAIDVYGLS